jgi:hypothetical protein
MKRKLLVVKNLPFWPPNNGGKACVYYRLEALADEFEINDRKFLFAVASWEGVIESLADEVGWI